MADTPPLVTVGMAVYNGETYIAEAIRSVLAETYAHWELLLVNDRSPDASVDVIRSFEDPRIRLIENEVNLGLVGVRNLIMAEARGTYVAWLDQDDITMPARLRTQVDFLQTHRDYGMCGSWTAMRVETTAGTFSDSVERLPVSHDQIRAAMLFLNPIACNTVMMRRAAFIDRGLAFRPEFGNSLDYDLWSVASDGMLMCNLPEVLGAYRVHSSQTSQGSALRRMNAHALQIQVELANRSLGIVMTDEERHFHSMATESPIQVTTADELDGIARWFGRLRSANVARRSFDPAEFDRALSRQWTTVSLAALRAADHRSAVIGSVVRGFRSLGVTNTAIASSLATGVQRRVARFL